VLRQLKEKLGRFYRSVQASAQGAPRVLEGAALAALRSPLIDRPEIQYRAGISNGALIRTGTGYLGIVKNNTYCFCDELGVATEYGPHHVPSRSCLIQVSLNLSFGVVGVRRLIATVDGVVVRDEDLLEDARLVSFEDQIWCSVNVVPNGNQMHAMPRLGRHSVDAGRLVLGSLSVSGASPPQKNWLPFSSDGVLYLQYSVNPHVVLRLDVTHMSVVERHSTSFFSPYVSARGPFYRGGSPPTPFDDCLLGAAHSMVFVDGRRDYRTHFYLTDARPPFKVRWFGAPVKLLRPDRIQYVCATLVDQSGGRLLVSYGADDCDSLIVGVPIEAIRATLRRVR
jgi:hypothetical protein